jgi:hypothetical protein
MKCPNYIRDLCYKRAKAAAKFMDYDCDIYEYLEKNNITHIVEDYDILTGCESICNPFPSADRIIQAIEDYEND